MPISLVDSCTNGCYLDFTLSGGAPDDGDLLLFIGYSQGSNSITLPDGWTELESATKDSRSVQVFYRFASGDGANFRFHVKDGMAGGGGGGGTIQRFGGVANPLNWTDAEDITQADRTAIVSPAITPPTAESPVFRVVTSNKTGGTLTTTDGTDPPTGYTRTLVDVLSDIPGKFVVDYFEHGNTSTGTKTYQDSVSGATPGACITFALASA